MTLPREPDDLFSQARHLLRMLSRMERLESLPRTGWVVSGVHPPESIASHVYMVTLTALWIADTLNEPVDTERLLRLALLHDSSEALLTDLAWPVKRLIDPDVLHAAEEKVARTLFEHAPTPDWGDVLPEYNAAQTLEARIVKASDRIQMLAKALQYESQHRGDTRRFWENPRNFDDFDIPLVRAILDLLRAMHDGEDGEHFWPANFD